MFVDHVHGGEGPHGGVTLGVAHQDVPGVGGAQPPGRLHHQGQRGVQGGQAGAGL